MGMLSAALVLITTMESEATDRQHIVDDGSVDNACSACEAEGSSCGAPTPVVQSQHALTEGFASDAVDAVHNHNQHALTKAFASDTSCLSSLSPKSTPTRRIPRERILYLIRHGEACHNIAEKTAMEGARSDSLNEGYGPQSPETLRRMEEARQDAIDDAKLTNCPLSDGGKDEAKSAKILLDNIIHDNNLPPPTEIIVSPLKRAKQTAEIVFPNHGNKRIRKEVRERLTGKPCDSKSVLWERRRRHSLKDLMRGSSSDASVDDDNPRRLSISKLASCVCLKKHVSMWTHVDAVEEDNKMVRERIRTKLFALIEKSEHYSIALVTHKGTLRELERGPFGIDDAKEFDNCEVRVYRVRFSAEEDDSSSKRVEVDRAERIA